MIEKNDIILITGKGHETYHIIGTKKWHFDDELKVYTGYKVKNIKQLFTDLDKL